MQNGEQCTNTHMISRPTDTTFYTDGIETDDLHVHSSDPQPNQQIEGDFSCLHSSQSAFENTGDTLLTSRSLKVGSAMLYSRLN